jgi:hypothetical protein
VGVPVRLAYDQWTRFSDWPSFMKKVESVQQDGDEKLSWRAQIFWSHRSWDSTIVEQVPDKRIVWRSDGAKGSVDGSVSFHELAPELTRILLVLEYHPKGLFEHTGNIWRAQGRRARLELKHFRRHVMSEAILHPDEIEGWRGVIEDGEVVQEDDSALAADEEEQEDEYTGDRSEDVEDEYQEADEDDEAGDGDEEEDEETSPNGRTASEGPFRSGTGNRGSGRGRRPAGRPQRSGRSGDGEDRPQRPARRRVPAGEGAGR